MKLFWENTTSCILLSAILALCGFVVLRLVAPFEVRAPDSMVSNAAPQKAQAAQDETIRVAARDFSAIGERPLFVEGRAKRLPETAVPAAPAIVAPKVAALEQLRSLSLLGVVALGEERVALVKEPGQGETRRIGVGDTLKGWKVVAIERNALIVTNGEEQQRLAFPPAPANGVKEVEKAVPGIAQ